MKVPVADSIPAARRFTPYPPTPRTTSPFLPSTPCGAKAEPLHASSPTRTEPAFTQSTLPLRLPSRQIPLPFLLRGKYSFEFLRRGIFGEVVLMFP